MRNSRKRRRAFKTRLFGDASEWRPINVSVDRGRGASDSRGHAIEDFL
jgi:hypothetical protein